jgi:hypothetical protein
MTLLPEEIDHYAWLIAGLVTAAARASTPERLAQVQAELEEAFSGLIARLDVSSEPTGIDPAELRSRIPGLDLVDLPREEEESVEDRVLDGEMELGGFERGERCSSGRYADVDVILFERRFVDGLRLAREFVRHVVTLLESVRGVKS